MVIWRDFPQKIVHEVWVGSMMTPVSKSLIIMVSKSPKTWGCGTPSKWPNSMAYKWGLILTTGSNWDDPSSSVNSWKGATVSWSEWGFNGLRHPQRNNRERAKRLDSSRMLGIPNHKQGGELSSPPTSPTDVSESDSTDVGEEDTEASCGRPCRNATLTGGPTQSFD